MNILRTQYCLKESLIPSIENSESSKSQGEILDNIDDDVFKEDIVQKVSFLQNDNLLIAFKKSYKIFNIVQGKLIYKQTFNLCYDEFQILKLNTNMNKTSVLLLMIVSEPNKKFISANPYQQGIQKEQNQNILYDFSKEVPKYPIETSSSIVVHELSGYFSLLRKYYNETEVIIFDNEGLRVKRFFINEECLNTYDHLATLVNYRQVLKKNNLKISLIPIFNEEQEIKCLKNIAKKNKIDLIKEETELSLQLQSNEKGIVYFVGRVCNNHTLVAITGEIGTTLILFNPSIQEIIQKVHRKNLLLKINPISFQAQKVLLLEYLSNSQSQTEIKESVLNCQNFKETYSQDYQMRNHRIIINQEKGQWFCFNDFFENWTMYKLLCNKLCSFQTAKIFVCQNFVRNKKIGEGQFVEQVYEMLKQK